MMKKKTTSKHFLGFIFKTSKTLKVKMQYNMKNFAAITNETAKKKQQLSYTKNRVKKADICSIMACSCSLGLFRFCRDPNLCSKCET